MEFMKLKIFFVAVATAVVVAALLFAYAQMSKERAADKASDQLVTAASSVQTGANGETFITLDRKVQQLIGLQMATVTATTLPFEVQAYGRVLDSTLLVTLHGDAAAARAALQASQQQYLRLKQLALQNNASAAALDTAEAQFEHDRSALDTAKAQLAAASCAGLSDEPEDFFKALAGQKDVLIRLDTPADNLLSETPTAARLLVPGMKRPVVVNFIGRAATTDPQVQGAGFILIATNPPPALTPGLAVTGFLQLPGALTIGVVVPDTAVVRSDESDWIYVQADETNFERRKVVLDRLTNDGWFVTNNVAPDDRVVVNGAQVLLSEEHKSEIQPED